MRYSQFQSFAVKVGAIIYDHVHLNIFQSIFNFDEFCINIQKVKLFHHFALEIFDLKIPQSDWSRAFRFIYQETEFLEIWDLLKHKTININFHYRTNWEKINNEIFFSLNWDSWTTTTRHGITRKRNTKRLKRTGNLFRKNLQLKDVC